MRGQKAVALRVGRPWLVSKPAPRPIATCGFLCSGSRRGCLGPHRGLLASQSRVILARGEVFPPALGGATFRRARLARETRPWWPTRCLPAPTLSLHKGDRAGRAGHPPQALLVFQHRLLPLLPRTGYVRRRVGPSALGSAGAGRFGPALAICTSGAASVSGGGPRSGARTPVSQLGLGTLGLSEGGPRTTCLDSAPDFAGPVLPE